MLTMRQQDCITISRSLPQHCVAIHCDDRGLHDGAMIAQIEQLARIARKQ